MSLMQRLRGLFRGEGGRGAGGSAQNSAPPHDPACREALGALYELLDGELEHPSCEEIDRHFRVCERCYPALAMEKAFREALDRARRGETAPPHLLERVLRVLQDSGVGSAED
jgi:anti-sigma factor (TIGR02949 family)